MATNTTSNETYPGDETVPFVWLDYTVCSLMLLVSIVTGLYQAFAGKGQKTTSEFLLAERSMSSFPITVSVFASYLSAISLLAIPAEVFLHGVQYWLFCFGAFITFPIAAFVFMPVYYDLGLISAYEYLHLRFNMAVRICGAIVFIFQTTIYLAVVLYAPALALEAVTDFPLMAMIVITGIICTFYTTLGGIKAVIWTDVFQFGVILAAIITILIVGTRDAGGPSYVWNYNLDRGHLHISFNPDPTERVSFWACILGSGIGALPSFVASQISVQRFMTAKSLKESQKSIFYMGPWKILMVSLIASHGLILFAFYNNFMTPLGPAINGTMPNITTPSGPEPHYTPHYDKVDQILIYFVNREFGRIPGIQGIFVACLYAACMSSVASCLNSLAAVVLSDIVRPWKNRNLPTKKRLPISGEEDLKEVFISKTLTVIFGIISVCLGMLMPKLGSLVRITHTVGGGTGGPILGLFSLGILCKRSTSRGTIIGLITGVTVGVWMSTGAMVYQDDIGQIPKNAFWLYRISFFWYSAITAGITMLIGSIASEIDRKIYPVTKDVDPSLLATFLRPQGWVPGSTSNGSTDMAMSKLLTEDDSEDEI